MATSNACNYNCTGCGNPVEILNRDLEFSVNFHEQCHKSSEDINQSFDLNQKRLYNALIPNMKHCGGDKQENETIIKEDGFSLEIDATNYGSNSSTSSEEDHKTQDSSSGFKRLVQSLPDQFRNMIIENKNGKTVLCSLCKCKISATTYNITTHLNGRSHIKKQTDLSSLDVVRHSYPLTKISEVDESEKLSGQFDKSYDPICNNSPIKVTEEKSSECDPLFRELKNCTKKIRKDSKYLVRVQSKENYDYYCTLCKVTIMNSCDITLLKKNIVSHLTRKSHVGLKLRNELFEVLDKMSSNVVNDNRQFLKKANGKVFCTLCKCRMSLSDSIDALKRALESHLSGSKHKNMIDSKASILSERPKKNISAPAKANTLPGPSYSAPALETDIFKNQCDLTNTNKSNYYHSWI